MPDKDGKLSPEEQQKIINWLTIHSPGPNYCPICKQNKWVITEHLIYFPIYTPNVVTIGGATYPCIQLLCTICGSVHLINAIVAEIVPRLPPDTKEVTNG